MLPCRGNAYLTVPFREGFRVPGHFYRKSYAADIIARKPFFLIILFALQAAASPLENDHPVEEVLDGNTALDVSGGVIRSLVPPRTNRSGGCPPWLSPG